MIHVNVTCDHPDHVCRIAIGVKFEGLTETFHDIIIGLRNLGWHVEAAADSRQARCLCPEHAPKGDAL